MADDAVITTGTSGNVSTLPDGTRISMEEVTTLNGGAVTAQKVQRIIHAIRTADGTAADVTASAPLPVVQTGTPALPTGAATEAGLDDILAAITALSLLVDTVEAAIGDLATGAETQPVSAASLPLPTGAATQTTLAQAKTALDDILTKLNASIAVTGTFWQATQPISAASLPLPTGAATETELESITAAVLAVGTAIADLATLSETQPVSIASALPAGTNAIGKLAANSGVDIGDVDVTSMPKVATETASNVASSATSVTLLASNASRKSASIYNDSTQVLYVKFGATASATSFKVAMAAGSYFEFPEPMYTGVVDGVWASANGNARVSEG